MKFYPELVKSSSEITLARHDWALVVIKDKNLPTLEKNASQITK